jgi:hypothetical protein
MVRKLRHLPLLGILVATVLSAGAISLKQLSAPMIGGRCPRPTCVKQSDCGGCFCNFDFGPPGQGICMIEPLAKPKPKN